MMQAEIETISDYTGYLSFFNPFPKQQAPISEENMVPQLFC